jgi:cell division protein FtsW (lipid II flippase)
MNRKVYKLRVIAYCILWLPVFLFLLHDDYVVLPLVLIFTSIWVHPRKKEDYTERDWIKRALELVIILPLIVIVMKYPEAKELSFTPLGYALRVMLWVSTIYDEWKNFPSIIANPKPHKMEPIQTQ